MFYAIVSDSSYENMIARLDLNVFSNLWFWFYIPHIMDNVVQLEAPDILILKRKIIEASIKQS